MSRIFHFLRRNFFTIVMVGLAFAIPTMLSYFFINRDIKQLKMTAADRFELQVNSVVAHTREKYNGGLTALRSLQAFFIGSEKVTRAEFYDFIQASDFFNTYHGFSTFAYIRRVPNEKKEDFITEVRADKSVLPDGYPTFNINPVGERPEYWPIIFISPEDKFNFLLGSDQYAETVRAENIARARDLGHTSLSTAVQLKQGGVGALIAAPLYQGKKVPDSLEDRYRLFDGAVTISMRIDDFFEDIFSPYELERHGFNIIISGRDNSFIPLFTTQTSDDFPTRFFGDIETIRKIPLGDDSVDLIFKSSVKSQLTGQEMFEPFLLILIFFAVALFILTVIVFWQKAHLVADMKRQYAFISNLSHQLRTPLTHLRWYLQLREVPEKEKDVQRVLMSSVSVLNSILDRLLLYITITKNGATLSNKKKVDVEVLYEKILSTMPVAYDISRLERKGDKLTNASVLVDEDKIVSALVYFIENALTYSPKDKKVTIELVAVDKMLSIIITDNGYGIPRYEQKKVFSDFFRASNASLGINFGSGVSIFMAKNIIEAHGGTVTFTSEEGHGSTFFVKLPLI